MHDPKRLNQLNFAIPGVKPIGLELIKLSNTANPDPDKIASTAELDPAIFGTIIACANSAMYGGVREIGDLRLAVTRLGLREIRRIVFHVVLESAFRADHPEINRLLRDTWTQSLATALIMQRLIPDCPQIRALPVEMVAAIYPLGLMHLTGVPVLVANFNATFASFARQDIHLPLPDLLAREHALFDGLNHLQLGAELMRRWGFPLLCADVLAALHLADPDLPDHARLLHSLTRHALHLAQAMGYAAMPAAHDDWLEGNRLDVSEMDPDVLRHDILDQMGKAITFN